MQRGSVASRVGFAIAMIGYTAQVWSPSPLRASTVILMTLEEAASHSDVVVLGRVAEIPELGVADPHAGVMKHNRVRVEQYLKGSGPGEIAVLTLGGKFVRETNGGMVIQESSAEGAPQLPTVGSDVVLFLRSWADGFVMSSWSHGVVPVQVAEDGARTVSFSFRNTSLMPQDALASFRKHHPEASTSEKPVAAVVGVGELRDVFDRLARTASR